MAHNHDFEQRRGFKSRELSVRVLSLRNVRYRPARLNDGVTLMSVLMSDMLLNVVCLMTAPLRLLPQNPNFQVFDRSDVPSALRL